MIKVNGKPVSYEGSLTIASLLKLLENDNRFSYILNFKGTIICNGKLIFENMYESTLVQENDEIKIIPLIVGG